MSKKKYYIAYGSNLSVGLPLPGCESHRNCGH